MTLRVVHWGTGSTGIHGLRAIIEHPDLELVGVHVHTAEKAGRDAGELCGLPPIGVAATADIDASLALEADCLSYMANGVGREPEAIADVVPFLERGTNVVTCSLIPFVFGPAAPFDLHEQLTAACTRGKSSFFNSGIDPGFATGQLVASLLALGTEIESVRVQELGNFSRYGAATIMRDVFGFGQPPTYVPPLFTSGMLRHWWTGTIREIADLLGAEIEDIELVHDVDIVDRDVDCAFGRVEAGTIGAVRFELRGIHRGKVLVFVEHVDRIALDAAPQWHRATTTEGTAYRVSVIGRPTFTCELGFSLAGGVSGAVVSTATYLVNAIGSVCAAPEGVLQMRDLAPFVGRRRR